MTNLYIDGKWTGYKGSLLSMALVSDEGHEFYEILDHKDCSEWVEKNVIPVLNKGVDRPREPRNIQGFRILLGLFLNKFATIHIIADWPEDIAHFCESLIDGPGRRIDTPPLTMEIARVDAPSQVPHNALWDARGLRDYFSLYAPEPTLIYEGKDANTHD